jgi:adhesin/invasin
MSIRFFQVLGRGRLAALSAAIALASFTGCGETSISVPLPAERVEAVTGKALSGPAGGVLPDPVEVRVFGSDDQPLPGTIVTFSVATGGSADPLSGITDGDGIARTRWTLGSTAGVAQLTATVGTGVTTLISATVTAAAAATVAAAAGEYQTAPAGTAVSIAPSVRVADAFGNLIEGVTVTFSVLSGGGRVTGDQGTTKAQGMATVGSWTLGPLMGPQTLAAHVEENGVSNNPIIFTATATMPTDAEMVETAGNNQEGPVGRLVPIAPTVAVRNAAGDGVPGLVVTFTVSSGGGSVVGSRQVTDGTGTAMVGGWFLGPLPGPNTITASSPGLGSVTFSATAVAGTPVSMVAASQTTQTAPVSTNVADPPTVIVRDLQGIPVPGVEVTFSVTAGGGTVVGSPAQTDANGIATLGSWEVGAVVGANTLTATATGLPSVTFNANATAGMAASVVAFTGDNQRALVGTSVPMPPTVRVTDASGNPVIGATVVFAVDSGGGVATGIGQLTNLQGRASVGSWVLGGGAPNTLTATVAGSGITGNPVTFRAQSATQVTVTGAPAGPINLGDDFTITAQLRDAAGTAVALSGVQMTIGIASGGGTLNGTLVRVTDASGAVSFTLINVTGVAGDRTFTITGTGLQSAAVTTITFN